VFVLWDTLRVEIIQKSVFQNLTKAIFVSIFHRPLIFERFLN